ncbi:type II secretion system protein M [Amantichitinum ursilacus]|uniref:Type II secretion system protein M n=1 Tax=Amantichitinum ursilacus TaxID=857265 RepID=A0A0N0GPM6_9NEIS|nr:type II secretion system protein M [Amantichitinum ursilacus]KPC53854.1 Type II secretion system protein M [Amantichitinum ursilacus]
MKARFLAFWLARAPRERAMLGAAAAVILIALLYVALWEPLVNQRAVLAKQLPRLQADLAQMQRSIALIKAAGGAPGVARSDDLRQAVTASLGQRNIKADIQAQPDNRLKIDATEVAFSQVLDLLSGLQRETGAHAVSADISSQQSNGIVHFTAVVTR